MFKSFVETSDDPKNAHLKERFVSEKWTVSSDDSASCAESTIYRYRQCICQWCFRYVCRRIVWFVHVLGFLKRDCFLCKMVVYTIHVYIVYIHYFKCSTDLFHVTILVKCIFSIICSTYIVLYIIIPFSDLYRDTDLEIFTIRFVFTKKSRDFLGKLPKRWLFGHSEELALRIRWHGPTRPDRRGPGRQCT